MKEKYPDLQARYRGHIAPVVLMVVGLWGYLLLAVYLRAFRAGVSLFTRKLAFAGLLIVAMGAYVGAVVMAMKDVVTIWVPNAFVEILVRQMVQAAPWSEPLLWLGCGLVLWMGYRRLLGIFERAELPVEAVKGAE